jgi:CpeT protein
MKTHPRSSGSQFCLMLGATMIAVFSLFAAGCHKSPSGATPSGPPEARPAAAGVSAKDLDLLAAWMTGSFSSEAQSKTDADFRDIRLHMVPIWKSRTDGRWLYVEQAVASSMDNPYRQRVYRLTARPDGALESAVFTLPGNPIVFAGAWKQDEPLAALAPEKLESRAGCSIILRRLDTATFEGGTTGKECPSNLRGAAYATSQVRIYSNRMVSWDRGFNDKDEQVWGAEKGGYEFLKLTEPAR